MKFVMVAVLLAGCASSAPPPRVYAPSERMTAAEHAAFDGISAKLDATLAESDVQRDRYYMLQGVYDTPTIVIVPHYGWHSHRRW